MFCSVPFSSDSLTNTVEDHNVAVRVVDEESYVSLIAVSMLLVAIAVHLARLLACGCVFCPAEVQLKNAKPCRV